MKTIFAALMITIAFSFLADAQTQAAYYVDPDLGSDQNAGIHAVPFQMIKKARDVIRTINTGMTGNIVVYLCGGTYLLDQAITLDDRDSDNKSGVESKKERSNEFENNYS